MGRHIPFQGIEVPETENPQEAQSVYPGKTTRHAYADSGRYFTQSPQCWFSRGTAHILQIRADAVQLIK